MTKPDEFDVEKALQHDDSKNGVATTAREEEEPSSSCAAADGTKSETSSYSERSRRGLPLKQRFQSHNMTVVCLILLLGMGTSAAILAFGTRSAKTIQRDQFDRAASDVAQRIGYQFRQYENAASTIHNYCRSRNFTRQQFKELYEYFIDMDGLDFKAMQFDPNVTHDMRADMEAEAEAYYAEHYPHIEYRGFVGFETEVPKYLEPRSDQPFYFPIHYMEPILGNEAAIDLDYYSHISRRQTLMSCMETGEPALTDRLVLVKDDDAETRCGAAGDASYGVVLMHPGVNLTTSSEVWPRDLSSMVICIPSLLRVSTIGQSASSDVYIYDSTDSSGEVKFLGGVRVTVKGNEGEEVTLTYLPEVELDVLEKENKLFFSENVTVASKVWTAAIVGDKSTYKMESVFVILCAFITLVASISIGIWVVTNSRRVAKFNEIQAASEAERAALVLKSAREATKAERELNDFIGHEVRNPVAAAMAACSFIKAEVNKDSPLQDEESRDSTRNDVDIIDKSLNFVNDLLRNMLDMHRATSKQLKVEMGPVDVLHDILEPVGGMLHQRGGRVKVVLDCPKKNLFVMADALRLKQVILNLGRNSAKFVERGFIRLRAKKTETGRIQLMVEDTGPGIPKEKGERLFNKYQESLDVLSQGTGIGLYLCKSLTELMGGRIYLDKTYHSGNPLNPGARFVVDLQAATEVFDLRSSEFTAETTLLEEQLSSVSSIGGHSYLTGRSEEDLPNKLAVLFVDDSAVLRKLFRRSIQKVAPDWDFREAANGEAAICLAENEPFDLIFVDQYMASVEKSLLGTETVVELRRHGVKSRICGLSANDLEKEFLDAGANTFLMKPFPTDAKMLTQELFRALYEDEKVVQESSKFD